jgi:periplasmic divalent cation tolerance protein
MTRTGRFRIVLVMAPDLKTGRRLASKALRGHLAACVNLVPHVESQYWWKSRIARGNEVLLIFKTLSSKLSKLEKLIHACHSYDTPEFLVLPVAGGSRAYLDWLNASCNADARPSAGDKVPS